jgi:two-component system sensor histidine kinase FlrB
MYLRKEMNHYDIMNQISSMEWLEAIPAGVIVIDENGLIRYSNCLANDLFSNHTTGETWTSALKANIKAVSDNGDYILCQSGKHIVIKTQSLPHNKGQLVLLIDESELKQNNESKIQLEKLDSIGKLSASLAHQLRTPLATAILYVNNLCVDNVNKEDIFLYQEKILSQLNIIKQQLDDVLLVYKGGEKIFEKIDVVHKLHEIRNSFQELYPKVVVNVNARDSQNMVLYGNEQSLCGAFNNIIENAIHASNKCNKNYIDINLFMKDEKTVIEFTDYGEGINATNIAKIKEGFFTTKDNGTGLGLSIAKSIVEAHQGQISIESVVNQYTKIAVILPTLKDKRLG